MTKLSLHVAAGAAALAISTGVAAQEAPTAQPYAGLSGGYHSLGFPVGGNGSLLFVKGGYQWVDLDLGNFVPVPAPGLDENDGDYIVGVGGDFALGEGPARLRVGVDTIGFDSVRATAGVVFKF